MTESVEAVEAFTSRAFRDMVSLFPTGVAIVTAVTRAGERLGATISSFVSISLDPPLVAFSLAKTARAFDDWVAVSGFAINLLEEHQIALSNSFARSMTDKWGSVRTQKGTVVDAPILEGTLGSLECENYARYEGGDHLVFVGHVVAIAARPAPDRRPLVFFGSRYRQIDGEDPHSHEAAMWLHGW